MNVFRQIQNALGIRPDEGGVVWYAFALFFWGGMGRVLMGNAAYSQFLAQYDSGAIPYIYILTGVLAFLVTTVYLNLTGRLALTRIVVLNLGASTVLTLLATLWLALWPSRTLTFLLPIWFETFCLLLPLALWGLVNRLFTVRQGKRVFGLIASGIPLGFIAGGLITGPVSSAAGGAGLLATSTASLIVMVGLAAGATKFFPLRLREAPGERALFSQTKPPATRALLSNGYVLLIFAILVCWTLTFFFVDNIFLERVGATFDTESAIASFMGIYSMVRGVLMLLVGVFLTGPILGRYGVRAGLLVLPAVLVISTLFLVIPGSLWGVIPFLFWPAVVTKLLDYALDTVDRSSLSILYQPLAADIRLRVQTLTEGVLRTATVIAAGVLLLVMSRMPGFTVVQLSYGLLVVLVIWLVVAVLAGRQYPRMLMNALVRRRLGETTVKLDDESSIAVLQQALHSPHPDAAIYVLNQLEATSVSVAISMLVGLLDHPAPAVRQVAAHRIEESGYTELLPAVVAHYTAEQDAPVRSALLQAMVALSPEPALAAAQAALNDRAPVVRQSAATALLLHGAEAGALAADAQLQAWGASAAAADRIVAAQTIGTAGVASYDRLLVALLQDANLEVRRSAIAAAACDKSARLWPNIVEALCQPAVASAAVAALASGGDGALEAMRAVWLEGAPDKATQIRLAQACGQMRSAAAADLLVQHLAVADVEVRGAVLHALQRCGYRAGSEQRALIEEAIWREIRAAVWVLAAQTAIRVDADPYRQLLMAALDLELDHQRERISCLLSLITDASAVRRAQDFLNAAHATSDQRAYAQEILDLATPQGLRNPVLALYDDLAPAERLRRIQLFAPPKVEGAEASIREVASISDGRLNEWTVTCARTILARSDVVGAGTTPDREMTMLSTLERVIILKSANIFTAVPDNLLATVADAAEETFLQDGEQLFAKGDLGQELYIVVSGSIRIHDGGHTLNRLGAYEVFGEMALLDAEPRSATATAGEETLLLCLRQEEFFELLEDHGAIARGVLAVLSQRLRARSEELARLHAA